MSPAPSWLTETPPTSCLSSTTWGTASWSWTRRWARRGCWRRPSSTTSPTSSSYSRRGYITGITAASRMGSMFTGEDLWQFIKTLYYGNPPTMQGAAVPRGWADPNGVNHERWMEVWTGTHRYYEDFEDYELELWVGQTNYYYFFIKGWGGYSYTKFLKWTNCSFPWNFNSFSFFFNSKKVQHSLFFSWEHHLSKFLERELLFADLIYRCIIWNTEKHLKLFPSICYCHVPLFPHWCLYDGLNIRSQITSLTFFSWSISGPTTSTGVTTTQSSCAWSPGSIPTTPTPRTRSPSRQTGPRWVRLCLSRVSGNGVMDSLCLLERLVSGTRTGECSVLTIRRFRESLLIPPHIW